MATLCLTDEFPCHDGDTIIPADKKCNGENDCPAENTGGTEWEAIQKMNSPYMCKGPGIFYSNNTKLLH